MAVSDFPNCSEKNIFYSYQCDSCESDNEESHLQTSTFLKKLCVTSGFLEALLICVSHTERNQGIFYMERHPQTTPAILVPVS